LSQHLDELNELGSCRVREVLARYNTRYEFDGKELTPARLLEGLGFKPAQLSAVVSDLSGGQKRRLQLMLILLDRPNVLILDEPDNDLDVDMLAVMEDLLDAWAGTLLLITHDRYLMERVTDDQFALLGGKIRHVPGGVDEYLRLLDERSVAPVEAKPGRAVSKEGSAGISGGPADEEPAPLRSRADEYRLKKERASAERRLETLGKKADEIRAEMKTTDASDYVALLDVQERLRAAEQQISEVEDEWVELSEKLT
jgi:ABC-type multidrug transport system ATPase subunit